MPYFVYKVFTNKTLESVESFGSYKEAKERTRTLRESQGTDNSFAYRIIFARHEAEAERLLTQKREPRPLGEDA